MPTNTIQSSFIAGELAPSLNARVDLDKWHQGAALMRNFFVDYRGGARNRAGTKWISKTYRQDPVGPRLVRFQFNDAQTYVMEFGQAYIRFLKNGGYILNAAKGITAASQANPARITFPSAHGIVNGTWFYMDGVLGMQELNNRIFVAGNVTSTTIDLYDVYGTSINSFVYGPYTGAGYVYTIYTLGTPYSDADLFNLRFTQSADVVTITHSNYAPQNLSRIADNNWTLSAIVFGTTQPAITGLITSTTSTGTTTQFYYSVTAVSDANGDESSPVSNYVMTADVFEDVIMHNHLNWSAAAGARFYNIYRAPYGKGNTSVAANSLFGLIGSTTALKFIDQGFTADYTITPPTYQNPFYTENPVTSTYFQERKAYAGSILNAGRLWTSQVGSFDNFNFSIPAQSDDAITATLGSLQVNIIKHMVPMPGGLLMFTTEGVWQVSGGGINTPITPTEIIATPQGYNGVSDVPPIVTNFDVLYVENRGAVVRDLSYNFFVNIYSSQDISTLSSHLFMGGKLVDWAFAEVPWKIVWAARNDGALLSMTYLKESEIVAWARHDTLGMVRSVCTINEGGEDYLYMVVERYNRVYGWIKNVERMASRVNLNGLNDAWFLDAALEYPQTFLPATLFISDVTVGPSRLFVATTGVFTSAMVGYHIRGGSGFGVIATYISSTQVGVDIYAQFPVMDDGVAPYLTQGNWSCTMPVDIIKDLQHLEGQDVTVLADGGVIGPLRVVNGEISLGVFASRIIVGLPYKSQLGTLYLDVGDANMQGRRKSIPAVTMRVESTRGLKAGPELSDMYEVKPSPNAIYGLGSPLVTDDVRLVVGSYFNSKGQMFIEQSYPLPATVLGIIPEVWVGDAP